MVAVANSQSLFEYSSTKNLFRVFPLILGHKDSIKYCCPFFWRSIELVRQAPGGLIGARGKDAEQDNFGSRSARHLKLFQLTRFNQMFVVRIWFFSSCVQKRSEKGRWQTMHQDHCYICLAYCLLHSFAIISSKSWLVRGLGGETFLIIVRNTVLIRTRNLVSFGGARVATSPAVQNGKSHLYLQ